MLDEAGGKVRVQDGVYLFRKGRVQSIWARLDQLCSGRDLDFKGAQRTCTVIQFGREKTMSAYSVSVALRASIALGSQPGASKSESTRGIWEVQYSRGRKKKHINCRADVEVRGGGGGGRPENRA